MTTVTPDRLEVLKAQDYSYRTLHPTTVRTVRATSLLQEAARSGCTAAQILVLAVTVPNAGRIANSLANTAAAEVAGVRSSMEEVNSANTDLHLHLVNVAVRCVGGEINCLPGEGGRVDQGSEETGTRCCRWLCWIVLRV